MKRAVVKITPAVKKKVTHGGSQVTLTRVYQCMLECGHVEVRTWEPEKLKCKQCTKQVSVAR